MPELLERTAELDVLRDVVESLAPLHRRAGSEDERTAADQIAARLIDAGADAWVEAATFRPGYAPQLLPLSAIPLLAGAAALRGGRRARVAATLVGALGATAIVDDVSNWTRAWRRLITRPQSTQNVVAIAGDPDAADTLVVMAHHDAAPTGVVFDQTLQHRVAAVAPWFVRLFDTSLPLWWPIAAGPALIALGSAAADRRILRAGVALTAVAGAAGANIATSEVVPGANDNLSAVAALVALARRLRERPVEGCRVMLVSCGAEEVIQGGVYDFVARRLRALDPARTRVLNLDTIGSPALIMLEGEGPFVMEDYCDPSFRSDVARIGDLRRGLRSRASTDAVIPSRAGYPTVTLASWDPVTRSLSNYHLPSDVPANLCYETIAHAVDIAEALARG